jgi:hypothetical protein
MASTERLAPVVALRDPVLLGLDLIDRIHEQLGGIPTRELGRDEEDREPGAVGATVDGYVYAPGSEVELREAVSLLDRAARLLESVRARESPRLEEALAGDESPL